MVRPPSLLRRLVGGGSGGGTSPPPAPAAAAAAAPLVVAHKGGHPQLVDSVASTSTGTESYAAASADGGAGGAGGNPADAADNLSLHPEPLGCWSLFWHRRGLHFATKEFEAEFMVAHLHSDEYYSASKWVFVFLAVAYLIYGVTVTALRCTSDEIVGLILRSSLLPLVNCLLFALAALFGWWRRGRRYANQLVWIVLAMEVVCFLLVPAMTPPDWLSIERQVADVSSNFTGYYPPDNATFVDGVLVGPGGVGTDYCAGRRADGDVTLCQSLNFQLGLGTLVYIIRCDLVFFYVMTVPVVVMILALPFRLYVSTLLIPFGSFVVMLYVTYMEQTDQALLLLGAAQDQLSPEARAFPTAMFAFPYYLHFEDLIQSCNLWNVVAYAVGTVAILSTCTVSAYTQERNHRSLFTLTCALKEQTHALAQDAVFKQYREVMTMHRSQYIAAGSAGGGGAFDRSDSYRSANSGGERMRSGTGSSFASGRSLNAPLVYRHRHHQPHRQAQRTVS